MMIEYSKQIKEAVDAVLELCDVLDENGFGTANYIPDSSTKEIFVLAIKLYCLYLASADDTLKDIEVEMIGEIFGKKESAKKLEELAEKSGAIEEEFGDQIPLILNCTIDIDNTIHSRYNSNAQLQKLPYITPYIYDVYSLVGAFIVVCDEELTVEEYNRFLRFMETMYQKIKADLNTDLSEIQPPSTKVSQALSKLNVSNEYLAKIRRQSSQKAKSATSSKKEKAKKENEKKEYDKRKNNKEENEEEDDNTTLEELLDQLNDLVGLHEVKYEVTSLINLCRVKQIREEKGMIFPPLSLHLVFSGNPGTGKTTVARLLAKIYKKIGVLSKGHLVEVDRSGLVGGYVGQTALKVQDVITEALGGILFIDEAYSLTNTSSTNDYGIEAVDTIVKAMEDHRDDLIIIVAGYPEQMEHFIKSNPGFKSRFNKFIYFKDYNPAELVEVFKLFCKQAGYRASLDALKCVREYFEERCDEKPEDFANAREVRNLFERGMMRQANRIIMVSDVQPETLTLLKAEDITGKTENIGKSEQLAQLALRNMSLDTRMGLPGEFMACPLDELELTARAQAILINNDIHTLGEMVDYLESGKRLEELDGMKEAVAPDIYAKIEEYGFEE